MNRKAVFACVMLCFALGCRGQLPPTTSQVTLGGAVPSAGGGWLGCGAGQSACTFVFSRAAVTGATCPAATGGVYAPLNSAAPATSLAYVDPTVGTFCYVAQTLQSSNVSVPSNTVGPFTVLASPLAPAITGQTTTASLVRPALAPPNPYPVLASLGAPRLEARVINR